MIYEPVQANRLFAIGLRYSHVNWSSFSDVLSAFEKRINDWYIDPIKLLKAQPGQHGAFTAMSMCCLLIDCLCQFNSGKVTSNRGLFINFIRDHLSRYNRTITPPIKFPKVDSRNCSYEVDSGGNIKTQDITSIAEAIYFIYRCGILHSAHAPLCGVISGLKTRRFSIRKKSLAKYSGIGVNGTDCPVVVIDPWKLFDDIQAVFKLYLKQLKRASLTQKIRSDFNTKFADCFGVDVSTAR